MKLYVWPQTFSVVQAKRTMKGAFVSMKDRNERTVIIDEELVVPRAVIKCEDGWRILTFDAVLEFSMVGFLARVSRILADEGISIFALSSFSTDHVMVNKIARPTQSQQAAGYSRFARGLA